MLKAFFCSQLPPELWCAAAHGVSSLGGQNEGCENYTSGRARGLYVARQRKRFEENLETNRNVENGGSEINAVCEPFGGPRHSRGAYALRCGKC